MSARFVFPLLLLMSAPAFCQHSPALTPTGRPVEWNHPQPEVPNSPALREQTIQHEAQDFNALSSSIQTDLQQLQKGLLAHDLYDKLRKMEKLAKKLREDMEPPAR